MDREQGRDPAGSGTAQERFYRGACPRRVIAETNGEALRGGGVCVGARRIINSVETQHVRAPLGHISVAWRAHDE